MSTEKQNDKLADSRSVWDRTKFVRGDWDFLSGKAPKELNEGLVSGCHWYEFSREDAAFREAVSQSRKQYADYRKKVGRSSPPLNARDAFSRPVEPLAYQINPAWPDTPFRCLKHEVRSQNGNDDFYGVIPLSLELAIRAALGKEAFSGQLRGKDWFESPTGGLWSASSQSDILVFEIPWQQPDETLKNGFARWLKKFRPLGRVDDSRPRVEAVSKPTGAATPKRQLATELKALGAYRLFRHYKWDRQQARSHDDIFEVLGPNYQSESAWTEARQRAEQAIERVVELNKSRIALEKCVGTSLFDTLTECFGSTKRE